MILSYSNALRLRVSAVVLFVVVVHHGVERVATAQTKPEGTTKTARVQRTREEVNALIEKEGRTPPPWFATTALNYPKTLELAWDQPPPGAGCRTCGSTRRREPAARMRRIRPA